MNAARVRSKFGAGLLATVAASSVALSVAMAWPGRPAEARPDQAQAAAAHADTEAEAVRALISKYEKSIDGVDTALASEIWSNSPDVSFIHPRGHERGWEQVKRNFYEKTMGAMFSERRLSARDVVVHVYGDAAWAEFYWDFAAKLRRDGSALKTQGRETQVFRKVDGRWSLVHVHYSGMPVSGERRGF
jgi:ketosteroid isomerase-like protein